MEKSTSMLKPLIRFNVERIKTFANATNCDWLETRLSLKQTLFSAIIFSHNQKENLIRHGKIIGNRRFFLPFTLSSRSLPLNSLLSFSWNKSIAKKEQSDTSSIKLLGFEPKSLKFIWRLILNFFRLTKQKAILLPKTIEQTEIKATNLLNDK